MPSWFIRLGFKADFRFISLSISCLQFKKGYKISLKGDSRKALNGGSTKRFHWIVKNLNQIRFGSDSKQHFWKLKWSWASFIWFFYYPSPPPFVFSVPSLFLSAVFLVYPSQMKYFPCFLWPLVYLQAKALGSIQFYQPPTGLGVGLRELCWSWGWMSGITLQAFSSWGIWCLLLWRREEWELRQWPDSKRLLNFIKEVSLCFCVMWNHYLTSVFPSWRWCWCFCHQRLLISSFMFAGVSSVWCPVLIVSLRNVAAASELLAPANNSKIRFWNLCSQLCAQDISSAAAFFPVSTCTLGACGRGPIFKP